MSACRWGGARRGGASRCAAGGGEGPAGRRTSRAPPAQKAPALLAIRAAVAHMSNDVDASCFGGPSPPLDGAGGLARAGARHPSFERRGPLFPAYARGQRGRLPALEGRPGHPRGFPRLPGRTVRASAGTCPAPPRPRIAAPHRRPRTADPPLCDALGGRALGAQRPHGVAPFTQLCIDARGEDPAKFIAELAVRGSESRLSVIETNLFKQITHISLGFRPGSDAAVKQYLATRLTESRTQATSLRWVAARARW